MPKILVYGGGGWIGGQMIAILKQNPENVIYASHHRLEEIEQIKECLDEFQPDYVLITAGLTGRPNVDWCESNKMQVLSTNVIYTCALAFECQKRKIHVTYFGTGCIYEYDETHDETSEGFSETDVPNFEKSYYAKTKIWTERILQELDNILIFRIRMPLSDDLHERNFITKITKYRCVVNVPNSMTVLTELLPIGADMMVKKLTGIYNFTNPGVISHNEILTMYQQYIDPEFTWQNFTLDEQAKILKAGRSNNKLDTNKLEQLYPQIDHITVATEKLFQRMQKSLQ